LLGFHQRHRVSIQWLRVVWQPCLLWVDSVLAVDFLWVVEVVPVELGLVPKLLLVGSVLVVDFLQMAEVVPAMLGLVLVLKKVV
jgi:hypothetical protein